MPDFTPDLPPVNFTAVKKTFSFFGALFIMISGLAQELKFADKIDPAFTYIITQQKTSSGSFKSPYAFRTEPAAVFVTGGSAPEKRYNCIVYTTKGKALRDSGIMVNSVLPKFVTAWVTPEQIVKLASMPDVAYVEAPHFAQLHNDIEVATSGAALLHAGKLNNTTYKGKGVIVAIFDTGIDWDHLDFRNPSDTTKSRILRIWDQTITAIAGETAPSGFGYGVEYTQAQINDELDGTPANYVRERDVNGHGTHVAGTAGGNGAALVSRKYIGMAPEADLVIIKGGNGTFSNTNIINGMTYLQNLANTLGKPVVLNMSLGGQFGPHDGTRPEEVAVDNFTSAAAGRAVVISAGNDNGTSIHNRFTLAGSATSTVSFTVPSNTTATDLFEYRVYANGNNAVSATVTVPGTLETITANAGQSVSSNVLTGSFTVYVSNLIDPSDGARYVDVYVQRITTPANTTDPAGTWTLAVTNNTATALTMDGWLYYKNTAVNTILVGGDNNYLVGSPGNATSAITVASYVGKLSWYSTAGGFSYTAPAQQDNISTFSSIGPRRDGVLKPEIAANGQAVVSCLSSDISPAPAASDVVEIGLYKKEQGTSMSSPGVAGAVALLLQTTPGSTASQIKTLLTSAATADALTGAVPNTTWGYGKLDVFKAAASVFNCSPANRKTYQYDNSFTSTQNLGVLISSQRIAVRFTPDISGKLGGVYYHTAATALITDLVLEIRTNNAGVPGALLGTMNVPVSTVAKFAWNYVDVTGLNISVATGTDYFAVIYRDPASSANWSLTRENTSLDNRSSLSADGGATWAIQSFDYRIRSVVYDNGQLTGTLAASGSADTRDINTSNQFLSSCSLIAQLVPNGGSPVSGAVTGKVWIDGSVQSYNGFPYVTRHYEITPATAPGSATGRVTLYFLQAEFDAFNAAPGSVLDLPANPSDAAGKANLKVVKFPGTSSNGTGLPATYSGSATLTNPADADIVWNADLNRWEVSFDVTGFSGFIVQTNVTVLPVIIEYFTGRRQSGVNILNWKANCTALSSATFDVQRSADSRTFINIGAIAASQSACSQPLSFTDAAPLAGNNFYRIKITENNGTVRYTGIILLQADQSLTTLYPTVISKGSAIQVNFAGIKGSVQVNDALGRQVYAHSLLNGVQSISMNLQVSGLYIYNIKNESGATINTGKIIVQ